MLTGACNNIKDDDDEVLSKLKSFRYFNSLFFLTESNS